MQSTLTSPASITCPACRAAAPLAAANNGDGLRCPTCGAAYAVDAGIPVVVRDASESTAHKQMQAAFFDEEDADFELRRPWGEAALYGELLQEKVQRSVRAVGDLSGLRLLCVCGGSGMDAEFLARRGASVTVADLSFGAVRRVPERSRAHGVRLDALVADVERLPFGDRAFDVVYVHDGLHHLEDPMLGLDEMVRVARQFVCVTEPADAWVTSLAVRAGIALDREEAGNRVERLSVAQLRHRLEGEGFAILNAERYAMFYRHHPGSAMRFFSRTRMLPAARGGLAAFNRVAGGLGNKLTITAARKPTAASDNTGAGNFA